VLCTLAFAVAGFTAGAFAWTRVFCVAATRCAGAWAALVETWLDFARLAELEE
jgi:hypothetical protein